MFNAGVRGKRAKDGVGFLSTAEQFNQKSFLIPTVTSFSVTDVSYVPLDNTAVDTAGGETIVINGSGFAPGATVQVGATTIGSVTFIDQNRLAFAAPALSSGSYTIYVTNSNGGTGILLSGLVYSGLPTFTTTAGTLGTVYETANINTAVVATGDAPITYTLLSGTLPAGANINSNGTITGTAPVDGSSTTYSFTIQASDGQLQDSTRAFTLTINTDVLSFSLANNTVYSLDGGGAMSNVTLTATSSANSNSAVTFAANTLPTGVSLSGNTIFGTPTVEETVYTAITATATQTGRTATRFVSWIVQLADAFWKYNTLLIPGASTTFVDDASTNNFAVTINGDTRPNNSNPYELGYYSNYFEGSVDYLTAPFSASTVEWFNTDYTIEMWTYIITPRVSTINALPLQIAYGTPTSDATYWAFGTNVAGNVYFYYYNGGLVTNAVSSITVTVNAWNHIAMVYTNSTGIMKGYINGIEAFSVAKSGTPQAPSGLTLNIGGAQATYYTGYISNLRIVKGTAVYTSNFTPSTTPLTAITNTSLLTCQAGRFKDNSSNNFTITRTGDVSVQGFNPFVPNSSYSTYGSAYFDGTGDYLSSTSNAAFAFGTGNFTIEAWVSVINYTGTCAVFDTRTSGAPDTGVLFYITGSGMLSIYTNAPVVTATTALLVNTWNHVAVTRSGTTVNLWLNGVSVGSGTVSTNFSQQNGFIGSAYAGSGNMMIGYISDLRVVKGTAVYTTAFTPPSAPLTAITNTSLLTLQNNQSVNNNTFLDNSTNNFLVTRNGNATQGTFSPYGGNWSNFFNGSTDYLYTPYNAAFDFATGDFTMECWFNFSTFANYAQLMSLAVGSNSTRSYYFFIDPSGFLLFGMYSDGYNGVTLTATTASLTNVWNHAAIVRNSGTTKIYLNGVAVATSTSQNFQQYVNGSSVFTIGREAGYNGGYVSGYISNARVVKGTAVYTSNFTPSTIPLTAISGTSLLTCADNRLVDDSINNFAITKGGNTSVQRFSPFNPSSVTPTSYSGYFDGTGDYLTPTASSEYAFATGDFTVECWVYLPSSPGGEVGFVSTFNTGGGQGFILGTGAGGNAGKLHIGLGNGTGSGNFDLYDSVNLSVNTWVHVAAVRSSGTVTLYKNGVSVGSGSGTNNIERTLLGISISYPNSPQGYVTGYISNVRIVKGTAVYTSTFTPSTTPLTAVSGTSLLTCQSPTFIDNSTNNFTITAVGNSRPTQQNPFGFTSALTNGYTVSTIGGSGYFDGTGDTLSVPFTSAISLGTGNFTMEAWCYPIINTNGIDSLWGSGNYSVMLYHSGTSWTLEVGDGGGNYFTIAGTAPIYAWNHMAVTRSGSNFNLWINGVSAGTGTTAGTMKTSGTLIIGGNGNGQNFTGYISDYRLVKGTALYTSSFVPPSTPLTAVQNTVLLNNMTSAGIYDAAMMNNMETVADAKLSTAVSKFGGSSMFFDGTGDYMVASGTTATGTSAFGSGDFTIEFWLYANSVAATDQGLIDMRPTSTNGYYPYLYMYNGQVTYWLNATAVINSSAGAITTGTWYHIALARSGSSNKLFINGVQSGSTFTSSTALLCDSNRPAIGSSGTTLGGSPLNGYIDDLRITKGYARYTTNFTPPTAAFKIK
jgi:hypothetical protein